MMLRGLSEGHFIHFKALYSPPFEKKKEAFLENFAQQICILKQ